MDNKEETAICRKCLIEKTASFFVKRDNKKGFSRLCKECYNNTYNRKIIIDDPNMDRKDKMKLVQLQIRVEEEVFKDILLEKMGYELNSELSVHQQFMIRHGLQM